MTKQNDPDEFITTTSQPPVLKDESTSNKAYKLGSYLRTHHRFFVPKEHSPIWIYKPDSGIWVDRGSIIIQNFLANYLGDRYSNHLVREVEGYVRKMSYDKDELIELGGPAHKVVMRNGVFNMDELTFDPCFNSEDYQITGIPVTYNPDEDCPMIKKFFGEILGNEIDQSAIEEFFGYCLLKDYPYAIVLMLLGGGANGKSTLLRLLREFLGERNVVGVTPQQLATDKFKMAQLHGKLANIAGDIPDKPLEYTGTIKQLTGGDIINADHKNQPSFDFRNFSKQIFSANVLPRANDSTSAFHRRMRIIEFPFIFSSDSPDTIPQDKLTAMLASQRELSGLFNLAIKGWKRLRVVGQLSGEETPEEKRIAYVKRSDPVEYLVLKFLYREPLSEPVEKSVLYDAYLQLSDKLGHVPTSNAWFAKRLKRIAPFIESKQKTIDGEKSWIWDGLGVYWNDLYAEIEGISDDAEGKIDEIIKTKKSESIMKDVMTEKLRVKEDKEEEVDMNEVDFELEDYE